MREFGWFFGEGICWFGPNRVPLMRSWVLGFPEMGSTLLIRSLVIEIPARGSILLMLSCGLGCEFLDGVQRPEI